MRSSPIAPVPVVTDSKKSSSASTSLSPSSSASDDVSPRRHKMTQPQFLTTTKQLGSSPFPSSANPHAFGTLDSDSPALTSSSISMEEENGGDYNPSIDNGENDGVNYHLGEPFVDRNHLDDNASTDDPYTYSDDSASLSDAYFLQQPSLDSRTPNGGHYGVIPLVSFNGEHGDSRSNHATTAWPGPPLIQVEDKFPATKGSRRQQDGPSSQNTSVRSSRRSAERNQRRNRRQRQQERNSSSLPSTNDKEPVNETTSLLDDKSIVTTRQRDREYLKKQNPNFARAKVTNGAIAKSYTHRQHRKKHQLRKFKRSLLLQEQQKRQEERERAVSEVRGKPQPLTTRRDRFWLVLFILQLFLVCSFAIHYGLSFYGSPTLSDLEKSSFQSPSMGLSAPDEADSMAASSMLLASVDNEDPLYSETVDRPLSTVGVSEDNEQDTDETELVANTQVQTFTIDYKNVLSLLMISGVYACIISFLNFAFMLILARSIIPIMLVFTIFLFMCWGTLGLVINSDAGSVMSLGGFTVFGISFAYAISNWNQIPFCSTNFHTAICAMRSSIGVLLVGISSLFVELLWLLIWTIALMGIFNRNNSADCEMWDECETHVYIYKGRIIEVGFLLVSLYWTTMVIKNIVRVAVAGAIGGPWWFATVYDDMEGERNASDRCCGCLLKSKVSDPLIRACTSSFGTICFGSLVEPPAQMLSQIVSSLCWLSGSSGDDLDSGPASEQTHQVAKITSIRRPDKGIEKDEENSDNRVTTEGTTATDGVITKEIMMLPSQKQSSTNVGTYFGILNTHLRRLDRVLQSCNRWSYVYIGMYNYSFYEGGEKAIQLFETREWMDIARDSLIQNILLMASLVIGLSTGMLAVLVEEVDGYTFTSLHKPIMTSFLIGFFLGFILSNILLLGLAASAVNTVLVCFAAEPFAFDRNHPHLSREMREVWSQQVWEPDAGGG